MISIVCVSNNQKKLNEMLVKSLKKQNNNDFELIVVDTNKYKFNSAADALNYGASVAKGEILCFCHQDIEFLKDNAIEQILTLSKKYSYGIAGVAGAIGEKKYSVSSTVIMGKEKKQAGLKNNKVINAYSLDECLLIIKKDKFLKFDNYGNTWHFYGVEYSNRCLLNNEKVLLFPIEIYHESAANSLNYNYFDTLFLYAKQNRNIKLIRTCCGYFNNNKLIFFYCIYRKIKLFLKKILKK